MRYRQNREQSAEILRLAIASMGRQPAGFHPCAYAVWYEHWAGLNPSLSQILEAGPIDKLALDDEEVWRLYTQHIAIRDLRQYETARDDLNRILGDTAASTQHADQRAADFDQALASRAQHLTRTPSAENLLQTVADLLNDTGKMRAVTAELSAKLKATSQEVSALTESLQRAQTAALFDSLTGLRNRRGFEESVRELTAEGHGLGGTALLMVDIDHFKAVNDQHGHVLGDKVLHAVAHVLRSNIKGRDIAARLGGEEFGVLLPDTATAGATAVARQIRALVASGRIKRGQGQGPIGQVTLSVGIAVAQAGESLESLMQRADAALYLAKRNGRNRVEICNERP